MFKHSQRLTLCVLMVLALSLRAVEPMQSEPGDQSTPLTAKGAAAALPFHGIVFLVNPADRVFILKNESGEERIFTATDATKFWNDGVATDLRTLKPGMEVRGLSQRTGHLKHQPMTVYIGDPAPPKTASLPDAATPAPSMRRFRGIVSAVDPVKKSFVLSDNEGGSKRFCHVSGETEFEQNGAKADFSALAVGNQVSGSYYHVRSILQTVKVKIEPAPAKQEDPRNSDGS